MPAPDDAVPANYFVSSYYQLQEDPNPTEFDQEFLSFDEALAEFEAQAVKLVHISDKPIVYEFITDFYVELLAFSSGGIIPVGPHRLILERDRVTPTDPYFPILCYNYHRGKDSFVHWDVLTISDNLDEMISLIRSFRSSFEIET
jgi:hypothetical protein